MMKELFFAAISISLLVMGSFCYAASVPALNASVAPYMQSCNSDADCTIADGQCGNSCGFVPLNSQFLAALEKEKTAMCGASAENESGCATMPLLIPSCIHDRCTIGNAYKEHASAEDYSVNGQKSGSTLTAASAARVAAIVPASGGRASVNDILSPRKAHQAKEAAMDDRHGFTAYDMPDRGVSTSGMLGTMILRP